jgi:putative heme-binding domain-containing protein
VLDAAVRAFASVGAKDSQSRELRSAWLDFVRDERFAQKATLFVKLAESDDVSRKDLAYAVLLHITDNPRASQGKQAAAQAAIDRAWQEPASAAALLRAIGQTRASKYALQIRTRLSDPNAAVRSAALETAKALGIDRMDGAAASGPTVGSLPFVDVVSKVASAKGDPALGGRLFEKLGCISCHTTAKSEAPKGPFVGDIAARYSRAELAESILKPSAKIAQGFETQKFATISGLVLEGFVVRESGHEVELRNSAGVASVLPKKEIDERGKSDVSVMPNGLADLLTLAELASLLSYLESLRGK